MTEDRQQQIAQIEALLRHRFPDSARKHLEAALNILYEDQVKTYPLETEDLFERAKRAIRSGDRDEGRRLLASVLREHPEYVPAWLWMSGLVEEGAQRRECLERVLALDPSNDAARQQLDMMDIQSIIHNVKLPPPLVKPSSSAKRLGDYLVEQGFVTKPQLDAALHEQEIEARRGINLPIGDILIRRRWLTMDALWRVLDQQKEDRRKFSAPTIVNRLGEYLVQQKMITSRQLDETLRRQDELRRKGKSFQLGELLIRFGVLSQAQLEKALDEQRTTFFSHMKR
ncbi:MAG TPA: hypothetical protein VGE07_03225 [Herpetosiphonaceae bacterium]